MAKLPFDPKYKNEQFSDFPRLKLERGERALILCLETPEYAYAHTLKRPALQDGRPVMHKVERRNGDMVDQNKMDFVGRPLCIGDYGVLEEKGVDVNNCPVCAESVRSDMVNKPERRFAMHVISYAIKAGGFDLAKPFQCSCIVWAFGDSIYNKLTDFVGQWGSLTNHDLRLGPCENADFQKYEIAISSTAAWQLEDNKYKNLVVETYKENQAPDLEQFCGRKVDKAFLEEDLNKVISRWKIVNGDSMYQDTESADQGSLAAGLDKLLEQSGDEKPAKEETQLVDSSALLGSSNEEKTNGDPETSKAEPAAVSDDADMSFEDLLKFSN